MSTRTATRFPYATLFRSGHAIIGVLGHLRGYQPGQVGIQSGDQAGRDDAPRTQRPWRYGRNQRVRIDIIRLALFSQEVRLALLPVRIAVWIECQLWIDRKSTRLNSSH